MNSALFCNHIHLKIPKNEITENNHHESKSKTPDLFPFTMNNSNNQLSTSDRCPGFLLKELIGQSLVSESRRHEDSIKGKATCGSGTYAVEFAAVGERNCVIHSDD
jgi:hypothetical protein